MVRDWRGPAGSSISSSSRRGWTIPSVMLWLRLGIQTTVAGRPGKVGICPVPSAHNTVFSDQSHLPSHLPPVSGKSSPETQKEREGTQPRQSTSFPPRSGTLTLDTTAERWAACWAKPWLPACRMLKRGNVAGPCFPRPITPAKLEGRVPRGL